MEAESKTELPAKIYGYFHNDGTTPSDEFLKTDADEKNMVEVNEERRVGVYELVGYAIINNTTNTTTETSVRPASSGRYDR